MDEYRGFIDKFVSRCVEDLNFDEDYIFNTVEAMNTFNEMTIVKMPAWWHSDKLFKDIMRRIETEKEEMKKQQWIAEFDLDQRAEYIARWKQSCAAILGIIYEEMPNVYKCA